MRRLTILILLCCFLILPVGALDLEVPEMPAGAAELMPENDPGVGTGFMEILARGVGIILPDVKGAVGLCVGALAVSILCSLFPAPGLTAKLVGTLSISLLLLKPAEVLVQQAIGTVQELTDYGALLLPVMTGALAASGGTTRAAGLYLGTAFFNEVLSRALGRILTPAIYILLGLTLASAAMGNSLLKKLKDYIKSLIIWALRLTLSIFSGYMALTGVVSGSADAMTMKAAKLTISGAVPVVGGMISDAAETILVSAGAVRAAAGLGGLMAVAALTVVPFLRSALQYLLLKLTAALCVVTGSAEHAELIEGIGQAMGLILAMMGTAALLQFISITCFMKGVT